MPAPKDNADRLLLGFCVGAILLVLGVAVYKASGLAKYNPNEEAVN